MFKRSFSFHRGNDRDRASDHGRVEKQAKLKNSKSYHRDAAKLSKLQQSVTAESPRIHGRASLDSHRTHDVHPRAQDSRYPPSAHRSPGSHSQRSPGSHHSPSGPSPIVTFTVGREGRLFAAHEDVLAASPFFAAVCRGQYRSEAQSKRIDLPDEEPEIFSCVLEYLYKGDYYPRLMHNKHRDSWELEDAVKSPNPENPGGRGSVEATTYISSVGENLLKDTVIYCSAEKYGLEELKGLALRKQGLQSGIEVATILRSARYAYDHTPDSDSRLRAHYLALIIRCRKTFKRSGTMQMEMESGGKLFFDLFVALCNHVDDIVDMGNSKSPKNI